MTTGEENFEFSVQCSAIFVITKILVIGLSLGTGIIGGHFWGKLISNYKHFKHISLPCLKSYANDLFETASHQVPCM